MTPATTNDAVEDDVVRYGLLVAAEEAAIAVVRAAHSQFIVEGSDAGIGAETSGKPPRIPFTVELGTRRSAAPSPTAPAQR